MVGLWCLAVGWLLIVVVFAVGVIIWLVFVKLCIVRLLVLALVMFVLLFGFDVCD